MPQPFNCPNCGATLDYSGVGRTMKCPYCGTLVQAPEQLWQPAEEARTVNQWKKYILIFLLITVGLPTCLGLVGTVVGIGGGIFAAIIPFIIRLLIH